MLSAFGQMLSTCAWCTQVVRAHARILCAPVLQIHEIFLRIRILGSIPLTNGSGFRSGSGSCFFVSDLQGVNKKHFVFLKFFFGYYFLKVHLHNFSKMNIIKKSQNSRNQCFVLFLHDDPYLQLMDPDPQHWCVSMDMTCPLCPMPMHVLCLSGCFVQARA